MINIIILDDAFGDFRSEIEEKFPEAQISIFKYHSDAIPAFKASAANSSTRSIFIIDEGLVTKNNQEYSGARVIRQLHSLGIPDNVKIIHTSAWMTNSCGVSGIHTVKKIPLDRLLSLVEDLIKEIRGANPDRDLRERCVREVGASSRKFVSFTDRAISMCKSGYNYRDDYFSQPDALSIFR